MTFISAFLQTLLIPMVVRGDGSHQGEDFEPAKELLLPNENLRFVARMTSGFLVLSDRRLSLFKKDKNDIGFSGTIPLEMLVESRHKKKDAWEIEVCVIADNTGSIRAKQKGTSVEYSTQKFEVKQPDGSSLDAPAAVSEFNTALTEIMGNSPYSDGMYRPRDYTHLRIFQKPLSKEGTLHMNTIYTDKPESDELQDHAREIMLENPYALWSPCENTHLFIVGKSHILFVRGVYQNGFIFGCELSSFKPDEILHMLMSETTGDFYIATAQLIFGETQYRLNQFRWAPPPAENASVGKWFTEPVNGGWIIADMIFSQQSRLMRANSLHDQLIDDARVRRLRFYY